MSALPPFLADPRGWLTTRQFSEQMGRPISTIQRWCLDGTLITAGMQLYRDWKGRYWIKVVK